MSTNKTTVSMEDVNQQLFAQMCNLNTELEGERLKEEVSKANAMASMAKQIFESKKIALQAYKLMDDVSIKNGSQIQKLIGNGND